MSIRRSLSTLAPLLMLAAVASGCSPREAATPATPPAGKDATAGIADGHFRATFGDRTIEVPAKDICLFGHLQDVGRAAIVNWHETAAEPLSFSLAMSPTPTAAGLQKIAGFSISHGNTGNVWMAPEDASLEITEFRRIEGGIAISGTFSGSYPAMIIPGQPQNPPMAVKGGFRNMECMDPAAFLPEVKPHEVPNSPLKPQDEAAASPPDRHGH